MRLGATEYDRFATMLIGLSAEDWAPRTGRARLSAPAGTCERWRTTYWEWPRWLPLSAKEAAKERGGVTAKQLARRGGRGRPRRRLRRLLPTSLPTTDASPEPSCSPRTSISPTCKNGLSQLKGAQLVAPMFLRDPARTEGPLCCHFIAMLVQALVERTIRTAMTHRGPPNSPFTHA